MAIICGERIQQSLKNVERLMERGEEYENHLDAAFLDAWSVVDVCHRIRRLIARTPGIKHNEPWLQLFLRKTEEIEELRNHIQHLDSGISALPLNWTPVLGTLSWVSFSDDQKCLTTMLGSLEDGITNNSITYDRVGQSFTTKIELVAGNHCAPILDLVTDMTNLQDQLRMWVGKQPNWIVLPRQTPIFQMIFQPIPEKVSEVLE